MAEGSEVYGEERSLNLCSFRYLKQYYVLLRAFHLDKSNLPSNSDAKSIAVHKILQPLNAMDMLMSQLEVAIREPTRPGVGLLTISAELATRMGALRINMCDSGVFRSGMASSLEHVMALGRCHGLNFKHFRNALNKIRNHGSFPYIVRKNNADISKSLPKQPPKYVCSLIFLALHTFTQTHTHTHKFTGCISFLQRTQVTTRRNCTKLLDPTHVDDMYILFTD